MAARQARPAPLPDTVTCSLNIQYARRSGAGNAVSVIAGMLSSLRGVVVTKVEHMDETNYLE